jgi:hypothetical protein
MVTGLVGRTSQATYPKFFAAGRRPPRPLPALPHRPGTAAALAAGPGPLPNHARVCGGDGSAARGDAGMVGLLDGPGDGDGVAGTAGRANGCNRVTEVGGPDPPFQPLLLVLPPYLVNFFMSRNGGVAISACSCDSSESNLSIRLITLHLDVLGAWRKRFLFRGYTKRMFYSPAQNKRWRNPGEIQTHVFRTKQQFELG